MQTLLPLAEVGLACMTSTRLGANQGILSATAPLEILYNISWSVHILQKVFQAHYLQYQTYCILVEHNLYIYHYHTTAYKVAICKPKEGEAMQIVTALTL